MPSSWLDETLTELAAAQSIGYLPSSSPAGEATAIAALALHVHGRADAAMRAARQLIEMQEAGGNVGVWPGQTPSWPTSLAIVAWSALNKASQAQNHNPQNNTASGLRTTAGASPSFDDSTARATSWLLANRGQPIEQSLEFGHNTELVGWAYAEKTHSWVEPTAFALLALKAVGQGNHAAAREGIAVLLDRQLPGGGLNYGNTFVLGQLIRPHVQPTGIALLALAGEPGLQKPIARSLAWLRRSVGPQSTPLSLGWALLGLAAHGIELSPAADWLAAAASRVRRTDRSPYKLALLALAQKGWPT